MRADGSAGGGRPSSLFCLVTSGSDRGTTAAARAESLIAIVESAVASGIDLVQIREPELPAQVLLGIARRAVAASRATSTRIVINDRLDVALAAGAAGVHLGGHSLPVARVRATVLGGFLVGRSVHSVAEARSVAEEGGADYLIAGTVFPSASKRDATNWLGTAGLAAIVAAVPVPVLGIGGITLDRVRDVGRTRAAGLAAIGLFADASRLAATVREARSLFDSGKAIP